VSGIMGLVKKEDL